MGEVTAPSEATEGHTADDTLPVLKQFRLGLTRNYYSVANVFGFKRLQEFFQVWTEV